MYGAGGRNISKLVVPFVAIVVIAVAGVYVLSQQNALPPTSTSASQTSNGTTGPLPSATVKSAVNQWLADFNNRDVNAIMNLYDFSAEVVWDGNSQGLQGAYAGSGNIQILYGTTIGKTTELKATVKNYTEAVFSPTNVNVTIGLGLRGNSTTLGLFNGTIHVVQHWVYSGSQWVIVGEHWNYNTFYVQFPASSTTFPQWTALKTGRDPNLVSEKSFEWHAGPFVAAVVYAFLFGIVVVAAVKYISRAARPS
jgi:hypothetical protein